MSVETTSRLASCVLAGALACATTAAVRADGGRFAGKTVTINVAGTAGGGIDVGARMIAPFLAKYLPGNPSVLVEEMPGAGGVRALQYLAGPAPRDGTALGAFATGPILDPILGPHKSAYGIDDFAAVGALGFDNALCTTWLSSPVKTLADARKRVVTVAGTGAGSDTDTQPVILNEVLGTKFKVITGYLGTQETAMAVERGEVDGRCGFGLNSIKSSKPDWITNHKINILVQMGLKAHPDLPNVPLALDLADTPDKKAMIRLMSSPEAISHPYLAPTHLDPAIAADIRSAFTKAVQDPQFQALFMKANGGSPSHPTDGVAMQKILVDMQSTPKPVVDRLRVLLTPSVGK
jgi:tripartite-type tricarboxylate transporter receptor subunit TctC